MVKVTNRHEIKEYIDWLYETVENEYGLGKGEADLIPLKINKIVAHSDGMVGGGGFEDDEEEDKELEYDINMAKIVNYDIYNYCKIMPSKIYTDFLGCEGITFEWKPVNPVYVFSKEDCFNVFITFADFLETQDNWVLFENNYFKIYLSTAYFTPCREVDLQDNVAFAKTFDEANFAADSLTIQTHRILFNDFKGIYQEL